MSLSSTFCETHTVHFDLFYAVTLNAAWIWINSPLWDVCDTINVTKCSLEISFLPQDSPNPLMPKSCILQCKCQIREKPTLEENKKKRERGTNKRKAENTDINSQVRLFVPCHKFTPQGVNTSSSALGLTGVTVETWLRDVSAQSFIQKCTEPMRRDPSRWIGVTNQPRDLCDDDWMALPIVTPHSYWIKMCFYSYSSCTEVRASAHARKPMVYCSIDLLFSKVWIYF